MVDQVRLIRLLRSPSETVAELRREQSADRGRRSDPLWLPGIKYLMIAAIEACVDAAQHVCSSEKWGTPRDNGSAMSMLGDHGVLTATTAAAMRRAVGFRNVLVHEYVGVDDHIVLDRLADLSDLERFVAELARWLSVSPSDVGIPRG